MESPAKLWSCGSWMVFDWINHVGGELRLFGTSQVTPPSHRCPQHLHYRYSSWEHVDPVLRAPALGTRANNISTKTTVLNDGKGQVGRGMRTLGGDKCLFLSSWSFKYRIMLLAIFSFKKKWNLWIFKWGYLPFICAFSTGLFSDPLLSSLKPVIVTLASM
jgi:hypothetical protein